MGFLDFFCKKPAPAPIQNVEPASPERLSYDIAYFILPPYVFQRFDRMIELSNATPCIAAPFYYGMACQAHGIEPVKELALRFRWHKGDFSAQIKYMALEYPTPAPREIGNADPLELLASGRMPPLAPYFSVVLYGSGMQPEYFILGQSPMPGVNTVRRILPDGANCNMGQGPEPELSLFFDAIRERRAAG